MPGQESRFKAGWLGAAPWGRCDALENFWLRALALASLKLTNFDKSAQRRQQKQQHVATR